MLNQAKLVFYSGGQTSLNHKLHGAFSDLVGDKRRKKLTYIPFHHDNASWYFARAIKRYKKFGFTDFECLLVDGPVVTSHIEKAFHADAIYLAGGNTFYYLYHLKKSGVFDRLKKFSRSGGVLGGLSAGGVIFTPSIKLAGYPSYQADKNEVRLKNLQGLQLTKFHFYPHYEESKRLNKDLSLFAHKHKAPIIAASDGSGLVVEPGGVVSPVGKVRVII